ncbi:MAG: OmpA family protein [Thiotrichales bacterium]|nr:OmpA family protein [Thiotrichales bacterium]
MKVFTALLTALFCSVPSVNSWAETQKSIATQPNLSAERFGIKTIITPKDDPKVVSTLYKDLDQDGVEDRIDHCLNTGVGYAVDEFGCELDTDKDGIYDRFDQCPGTPLNTPVNFLGCEGDQDKDRVLDSKDECPNTPLGTKVDERGCKIDEDQDRDGVIDSLDICPDTPLGTPVNPNGCKPEAFVITNIIFDTASYNIRADQQPILEKDAAKLRQLESGELLVITGYTDSVGKAHRNEKLSWNRAQSTKDYLVKTFNIPEQQVYVHGKGENDPIATNGTVEGRQKNRRISLEIKAIGELPKGAKNNIPKEMLGYTRYENH